MNKKIHVKRGENRQGRRKRIALLEAAGKAFAKHGYSGTTVRDIAQISDVQPSALIYHFGTKENLFQETLKYHILENVKLEHIFDPFNDVDETNAQAISDAILQTVRAMVYAAHGPKGKVENLNGLMIALLTEGGKNATDMVQRLGSGIAAKLYHAIKTNRNLSDTNLFWWTHMFWGLMFYSIGGEQLILSKSGEKRYSKEFVDTLAWRIAKACCADIGLPIPEGSDTWFMRDSSR